MAFCNNNCNTCRAGSGCGNRAGACGACGTCGNTCGTTGTCNTCGSTSCAGAQSGGGFSCIINLIIILIVLDFLSQIICGIQCGSC